MKFKLCIFSVILIIISTTILNFAYMGHFPFNKSVGKNIHYFVYDNYNIAFNHYNMEYDNKRYWCKESRHESKTYKFEELKLKSYDKQLKEIQILTNKLNNNKYSKYELESELIKTESSFEYAHILKDNYYLEKGNNQNKVLKAKYEHNKQIDKSIKNLEELQKEIYNEIDNIVNKILINYCVEVL